MSITFSIHSDTAAKRLLCHCVPSFVVRPWCSVSWVFKTVHGSYLLVYKMHSFYRHNGTQNDQKTEVCSTVAVKIYFQHFFVVFCVLLFCFLIVNVFFLFCFYVYIFCFINVSASGVIYCAVVMVRISVILALVHCKYRSFFHGICINSWTNI